MREIIKGAKQYGAAWRLIWREKMWPLLLIPGLIGVMYFPCVAYLTYLYGGKSARYLRDEWLPEFLKQKVLFILVTVALWIFGLYLGFVLFRNVVMILYSPVLSYMSRKTEEKAEPAPPLPEEPGAAVKGAIRGILMSLTSLALAIACFGICICLLIIPVIGQVAMAVLLPMSQMFLAGHGFMDPTLERRQFSVSESFRFAWRFRYRALGCGAVFVLFMAIPIVGWFLGPTVGIVAGTLLALDNLKVPTPPSPAPAKAAATVA